MKKINCFFTIMLIFSCIGVNKTSIQESKSKASDIRIITQHWNTYNDSINLYMHFVFPVKNFVFKKRTDHFYSELTVTLIISDITTNRQVFRSSWNEMISEPFYENTRNSDNYYKMERSVTIIPGQYKIFMNVQDLDSRKNWTFMKEYNIEEVKYLGPILLFTKNNDGMMELVESKIEKTDTVWLRTQVQDVDLLKGELLYSVITNKEIINSGEIFILDQGVNDLYYLPVPILNLKQKKYEIELRYMNNKQSVYFSYKDTNNNYWTDDIDEVVGVMRYILPSFSEYKVLKAMDEAKQWLRINQYWQDKDPSPNTSDNELLIELNERVRFTNNNFSILMNGWQSDRGRIYIVYGAPSYIDESKQGNMGYRYQKWVYPSGKEFIFIDRTMSGNYTLYKDFF